jgi:adenylate cyclase
MKRKISAILASDIVGYSKLVIADEEETVRRLATYRKSFEELVTAHEGRVVNTAGDAILAEFPSSVEAVRCAVEIQDGLRSRNGAYPPARAMMARIGINVGDVLEPDSGDLLGDGVNIAARLEQVAPAGTICVSRTVYEQTENKVALRFEDIGPQQLKNIANPVHAYVIHPFEPKGFGRNRISVGTRFQRPWGLRAAIAAACVIALISIVVDRQMTGRRPAEGVAANAEAAVNPAPTLAGVIEPLNEPRLRELATQQNILLPAELKVLAPMLSVSPNLTRYVGAWGGEGHWSRGGRRAMLIVESVDNTGTALGIYAHSPSNNPNVVTPRSGSFTSFVGTITDDGLRFTWGQSKYRFTVAPDSSMWGLWQLPPPQGDVELTITLGRVR